MKERNTLHYKNISLILFSKRVHSLLLDWEIHGETYTQRGDFYLSYTFFREPGGCQRLHPLASRIVRDASDWLCVPCSTPDSLPLSKFARVVLITWSPSDYTPVGPDCSDTLFCLLITTWQLVKAHGVTRNEPKIHVMCYITLGMDNMLLFKHWNIYRNTKITSIYSNVNIC